MPVAEAALGVRGRVRLDVVGDQVADHRVGVLRGERLLVVGDQRHPDPVAGEPVAGEGHRVGGVRVLEADRVALGDVAGDEDVAVAALPDVEAAVGGAEA